MIKCYYIYYLFIQSQSHLKENVCSLCHSDFYTTFCYIRSVYDIRL